MEKYFAIWFIEMKKEVPFKKDLGGYRNTVTL